jgi:hypothetical protein
MRPTTRIKILLVAVVLAAALALLLRLWTKPEPHPAPAVEVALEGRGVTLSRLDRKELATWPAGDRSAVANGEEGDWILATDSLRLVVGSQPRDPERRLRYGAVIDAVCDDFAQDQLLDLRPVVFVSGEARPLDVESVMPASGVEQSSVGSPDRHRRGPEVPVVRITQSTRDRKLRLVTDISVERGRYWAEMSTRAENVSDSTLKGVQIGDRVRWPGVPAFAPRLGFVLFAERASVPWIARAGRALSYALVNLDGVSDVSFTFDRVGPVQQTALGTPLEIAPHAKVRHHRALVVVPGGLDAAARLAWSLRGRPLATVHGTLDPPPRWASIEALHPDGHPVLIVRADAKGHYELPLPLGHYRLVLRAPGGQDDQDVTLDRADARVAAQLIAPQPGSIRYTVSDPAGTPLPARFVLRGVAPTPDPNLGPDERADGVRNIFYATSGSGVVELPPGTYRVTVIHGTEYSIAEETVRVSAAEGSAIRAVLERVVDTAGWIAADLHVHQAPSPDSTVTLDDRIRSLIAEGIEFAVPTDHNHVTDLAPSVRALGVKSVISTTAGVEVTTSNWGHFNAFPYPQNRPTPPYLDVDPGEIFSAVRSNAPGALIQVNHPRMKGIGYFNRMELDPQTGQAGSEGFSWDFDTLEVFNGFELQDPNGVQRNLHEWFELLNLGRTYTAVGNSDSHRLVSQWAGYPRTYVRLDDAHPGEIDPTAVARSLLGGHAIVSHGPFVVALVNGAAGPGDRISAEGHRISVEISVRAPSWVDAERVAIYSNGVRVAERARAGPPRSGVQISWQADVELDQDAWVVVVVTGKETMERVLPRTQTWPLAFTNPVFVDADGDGMYRAPVQRP